MVKILNIYLNSIRQLKAIVPNTLYTFAAIGIFFAGMVQLFATIITVFGKLSNINYVAFIPIEHPSWGTLVLLCGSGMLMLFFGVAFILCDALSENDVKNRL